MGYIRATHGRAYECKSTVFLEMSRYDVYDLGGEARKLRIWMLGLNAFRFDDLSEPRLTSARAGLAGATSRVTFYQFGQRGFDFAFGIVLARLLSPADFGVVAAATIFIQFAQLLVEIGIGATLVHMPVLTIRDLRAASTIIYINAGVYALLSLALAPVAERIVGITGMQLVIQILALQFLLQAPGIVPESILLRRLQADKVARIQFFTRVLFSGTVGIGLALLGWGYWALVASTLTGAGLKASALFAVVRPPSKPLFEREAFRRVLSKGLGFSASRLINFVAIRGDNTLVGYFFNAAALGLYSRAYNLMNLPADLYATIAERVLFPAMARVHEDRLRFRQAFLKCVELTATVGIPLSLSLYMTGPEVILVLLGPKWAGAIPLYQILALVTYFRLGMRVSTSSQRAAGATNSMILTQTAYAALVFGGCLVAAPYGLQAIAIAVSAGVVIAYLLISRAACEVTGATLRDFLAGHRYGICLAILIDVPMFGVMQFARSRSMPHAATLFAAMATFALIGGMIVLAAPASLIGPTLHEFSARGKRSIVSWYRRRNNKVDMA